MTDEIYQSSTHGDIPLSFTGRRLLANLREATNVAIAAGDFNTDDMALSKARGAIAKRMSELEGRNARNDAEELARMAAEVEARAAAAKREQLSKDVIDAALKFNTALSVWNRAAKAATDAGMTVETQVRAPGHTMRKWRAGRWPGIDAKVRS
jgi:hypothetical protein